MPHLFLLLLLFASSFATPITHTGYLADIYCYEKPGNIGIDGTNMRTDLPRHSVHCLRDIPQCYYGYYLMETLKDTQNASSYVPKYKLDNTSNTMMLTLLRRTTAINNYSLMVHGDIDSSSPIPIISLENATDNVGQSITVQEILPTPAPASTVITYTGYLADIYCYERAGHIGIDGTDMANNLPRHSVHCLRDIPQCYYGFYLMETLTNQSSPYYVPKYKLDSISNTLILSLLRKTTAVANYSLTVTGINTSTSSIPVISLLTVVDNVGISITLQDLPAPAPAPSPVPAPSSSPSSAPAPSGVEIDFVAKGYTYKKVLIPSLGVTLYWKPAISTDVDISFAVQCQQCTGYVGIGFSEAGKMTGTDGIIGFVDPVTKIPNVSAYNLQKTGPTPLPSLPLSSIDASIINGKTTIFFTRPFNAGNFPIKKSQLNHIIAAVQSQNGVDIIYHGDSSVYTTSSAPVDIDFISAQSANQVTYTGYLADIFCWNQPGHIGIDGTNMNTNLPRHSVHCLKDIPACYNGYYLMETVVNQNVKTYVPKYKLDDTSNKMMLMLMHKTTATSNYSLTVTGIQDSSSPIPSIALLTAVDNVGASITLQEVSPQPDTNFTFSGLLADIYCWERPGHIGIDGTNMSSNLPRHSVHCLRDIPQCYFGYYLMEAKTDSQNIPYYVPKYKLDDASNRLVLALLRKTTAIDNYVLTVIATMSSLPPSGGISIISLKRATDSTGLSMDMNPSFLTQGPAPIPSSNGGAIAGALITIILVLGLIGGGIWYYKTRIANNTEVQYQEGLLSNT